jgi:hypothetical protein
MTLMSNGCPHKINACICLNPRKHANSMFKCTQCHGMQITFEPVYVVYGMAYYSYLGCSFSQLFHFSRLNVQRHLHKEDFSLLGNEFSKIIKLSSPSWHICCLRFCRSPTSYHQHMLIVAHFYVVHAKMPLFKELVYS